MNVKKSKGNAKSYANMSWGYSSVYSEKQTPVTIGGWTAIAWQEEEKDFKFYSKAWHRQYGPKITITGRFVKFTSPSGKQSKTVELDSWRGNWQMKALLMAGLVKPQKGQMHIRLNEAVEIRIVGKKLGFCFYERTLKGDHLDYCAVSPLGLTYHAETPALCVAGVRAKAAQIERRKVATIDFKFLQGLGFCRDGIKEFCSIFDFDLKDSVTPQEIYDRVKTNLQAAAPFASELKKLAEAVEFDISAIG